MFRLVKGNLNNDVWQEVRGVYGVGLYNEAGDQLLKLSATCKQFDYHEQCV